MKNLLAAITLASLALGSGLAARAQALEHKVKVFILAGQSNMEGHGQLRSLAHLGDHPEHGELLKKLQDERGAWAIRDDVTIAWRAKAKGSGPLTVGWGAHDDEIGPELMFGTIMGERYDEPVLLIKVAWGGKDVFCDFRSPGAGPPTGDAAQLLERERAKGNEREVGLTYRKMIAEIRTTLENLEEVVPGYAGQGYELAGMAWFQGWNDYCRWREAPGIIDAYPRNLAAMIRDLRADLGAPEMPVVIGEMGVGGREFEERAQDEGDGEARSMMAFRRAQRAAAEDESLAGVTFVPTADFWDVRLEELRRMKDAYSNEKQRQGIPNTEDNQLPTKALTDEFVSQGGHWYCHYNGSAANYALIGYALAMALDP